LLLLDNIRGPGVATAGADAAGAAGDISHQTPFTPDTFYTRLFLHQTALSPNAC